MKILVVESDSTERRSITSILEKHGHEVIAVASGTEAVAVFKKEKSVDIVITDIVMPVMDGFSLLSYLKADAVLRTIPVIMCSAALDVKTVTKGANLGAADYIAKPVHTETLMAKVMKAEKSVPGPILIVDDEELLRSLLRRILEREGFRVIVAESGTEALEMLGKTRVGLVISDIVMPEMNGIQLIGHIKKRFPSLPVLLVTGHASEYSKRNAVSAGADGYISKPFHGTEITERVRVFLSESK
jgi:DNA-binding response OmpR family regulator